MNTCIVTGASSGIGKETAVALAQAGAHVAIVCRTQESGERTVCEIRDRAQNSAGSLFVADLASLGAIRGLAGELDAALPRIDVLVNNAGLTLRERVLTPEGLETTFAVNHLAYFLLTRLPRTRTTFGVNTESAYDWENSQWTVPINATVAQLVKLGPLPIQLQLGYRYYAERPIGGPDWGIRFTFTFLFPK